MKAIEIKTHANQFGNLEINYPLMKKNQNVRVLILLDEENEEELWMKSVSNNPAFDFLKDEEDIYTLNDGNSIEDEK